MLIRSQYGASLPWDSIKTMRSSGKQIIVNGTHIMGTYNTEEDVSYILSVFNRLAMFAGEDGLVFPSEHNPGLPSNRRM